MRTTIGFALALGVILLLCSACAVRDVKNDAGRIYSTSIKPKSQASISIEVRGLCDSGAPALEVLVSNNDDVDHEFDLRAEPWALNAGGIAASVIDYAGRSLGNL